MTMQHRTSTSSKMYSPRSEAVNLQEKSKSTPGDQEALNAKEVHDNMCAWVIQKIKGWRKKGKLSEGIYSDLWDGMIVELAAELDRSQTEIIREFSRGGITKENFYEKSTFSATQLEGDAKALYDELHKTYQLYFDKSNEEMLSEISRLRKAWSGRVSETTLSGVFGVAESSFTFWRASVEDLYGDDIDELSDPCRRKIGMEVGLSDLTGALVGGIFGGIVGATVNGVRASLVSAVSNAANPC